MVRRKHGAGPKKFDYSDDKKRNTQKNWKRHEKYKGGEE